VAVWLAPIKVAERRLWTWAASATLADRLAGQVLHRGERLGGLGGPAPLAFRRGVADGLQFAQGVRAAQLVIRAGV
jgi:hypothetical protein